MVDRIVRRRTLEGPRFVAVLSARLADDVRRVAHDIARDILLAELGLARDDAMRLRSGPRPRDYWTKARVIAELRIRAVRGEPLDPALECAARRQFGSLPAARRAARVASPARWTRERILDVLRADPEHAWKRGGAIQRAIAKHFGSMTAARIAARVPVLRIKWTADAVLRELRRHKSSGHPVSLKKACLRYFGGINAARRAAGLPAAEPWSKARVLAELRVLGTGTANPRLARASRNYFGSVRAARKAARVPLASRRRGPSRRRRGSLTA